jgi:hypothetical protein
MPAYTLPVGSSTLTATVTDKAGNTGSASTYVMLTVTPNSLCLLTKQFIQASARYQSLTLAQRAQIDQLANYLCNHLASIQLTPTQKLLFVKYYDAGVAALVPGGWLTQTQATILIKLANAL